MSLPVGTPPSTGWPVVVFIHGGGWIEGDKSVYSGRSTLCDTMTVACAASIGFAAFALDYRLIVSGTSNTYWPAQLLDVQLAIRWIRNHASAFHINQGHICATGDSAGSSLALQLAAYHTVRGWDTSLILPDIGSQVQCVVDNFGPITWGPVAIQIPPAGYTVPSQIAGNIPLNELGPTMIVQGTADTVVTPQNSMALFNQLTAYNLATPYYSYPGNHEFTLPDGKTSMGPSLRFPILNEEYMFMRTAIALMTRGAPVP